MIGDRTLTVFEGGTPAPLALAAAENAAAKMTVKVLRAGERRCRRRGARGRCQRARRSARRATRFGPQDRETEAAFDLPVELRNDIARLEISGERSAGAVQLLDKRWRRRAIGIVTGSTSDTAQPLLASTFYLTRALAPFADVRLGDRGAPQQAITQFLDQKLPMIVLADVGTLSPEIRERINAWIEQGGVLVRFAGPRLAQADDDLVPVKLRRGGRSLGGSLTWEKPQHLASFAADGPFAGPCGAKGHHRQPAGAGRAQCGAGDQELGLAGRRHAAGDRRASRQGRRQPVSCQRRHALVGSADVRQLRRDAAADRRYVRLHLDAGRGRRGRSQRRDRGAAAHARRFRRVRTAALDRKADAGRLPRPRHAGSSARLLRPGRRPDRGQHAGGGRPHRAARYREPARAPRQLHQCRTARSARNPAVVVAGAVPDRRRHRRHARRRHGRAVAARRAAPAALAFALALSLLSAAPRRFAPREMSRPRRRQMPGQRRIRHRVGLADPARLCRHRQCRRRFDRARPAWPG